MPYRWVFGDLRTGRIYRPAEVLEGEWTATYDLSDSLSGKVASRAVTARRGRPYGAGPYGAGPYGGGTSATARKAWRSLKADTAPCKSFVAVAWVAANGAETWLCGGPIWGRSRDEQNGLVSFAAGGVETYYFHRKLVDLIAQRSDVYNSLNWTAAQTSLFAKRFIETAHLVTGGALPIVLPTDAELGGNGTLERNFEGHALATIGEKLTQLTEESDGPEVQFVPRRNPEARNFIQWEMRIGVQPTMALTQAGTPWVLDRRVPRSPILNIVTDEDGARMGTRAFGAGEGQGSARPISVQASDYLTSRGYPVLDVETGRTDSVSEQATLDARTLGLLAQSSLPLETHTVTVARDGFWKRYPSARPGDMASLWTVNDGWFDGSEIDVRWLSLKGGGNAVEVACAPRAGRL